MQNIIVTLRGRITVSQQDHLGGEVSLQTDTPPPHPLTRPTKPQSTLLIASTIWHWRMSNETELLDFYQSFHQGLLQ